jgi:hypothetical protein
MKIEISTQELESILSGDSRDAFIKGQFLNIGFSEFQKGQRDKEEEIYRFLAKRGFIMDCKHGRPIWSCKECLK